MRYQFNSHMFAHARVCVPAGVALGIAFAYSWQLTLLTLGFTPFMAIGGAVQAKILTGQVS